MSDLISRQAAIDALNTLFKKQVTQFGYEGYEKADEKTQLVCDGISYSIGCVLDLPSAQPEIIRCNVCRHWHQTTGEMKGFGLGDCDYLEKKLVTCNGYCYWAERKEDE